MIPLKLAKLSPTKDTGRVFGWLVQDGVKVATGQPVVEIEMGRVTMEVESPAEGTIRIVVQRGTTVPVVNCSSAGRPVKFQDAPPFAVERNT